MKAKPLIWLSGLLVLIGLLAGCATQQAEPAAPTTAPAEAGGAPEGELAAPAATPPEGSALVPPGGGAAEPLVQLALGTLYLQDTEYSITAEQAATLLPYWNQLKALQESGGADPEQIDELLSQIDGVMTTEQTTLLANLSQEELATWAQDEGLMAGFGGGPPGGGQPGEGGGPPQMSEEELATAQAARGQGQPGEGGPGQRAGMFMIDPVIAMLEDLSGS